MTTLNIGKNAFNSQEVANKLSADILFLEARIALLNQQTKPNLVVLHTYQQMLESRRAVLGWIDQVAPQTHLPMSAPDGLRQDSPLAKQV